ncbi:MAG TPA: geranylgeranylglycerol-phosphate geranylgeranyltransferase [Candidatus Cloacimonadota bacterium]|nr:geranylgeranylglycerol-phosphate geranylgeranyltransferase [Candidatus Cloacimonadota bacterium]HQB40126.1 geranylgeranylglycerol-phosphate geranylgeranyltransferase [Candidatus Cloacimonadota bacterium]
MTLNERYKLRNIVKSTRIIRPLNCIFSFICVLFGTYYSGGLNIRIETFLIALSATLIAGAGYVVNDIFDLEIDKINQPQRVLPQGLLNIKQASIITFVLLTIGLLLSLSSDSIWHLLLATVNALLLLFYAIYFKKIGLIGNLVVAWTAASTFLYGALLTNSIKKVLPIMIFAFLYTLIREWTKTIEDYEGDKSQNAKTVAIMLGKAKTVWLLFVPAILLLVFIFVFYRMNITNPFEFLWLNILVVVPLALFLTILLRSQNKSIVKTVHKWMKIDMLILLLIYVVSYLLD